MEKSRSTIHTEVCDEIHELYELKNADYGDSFSRLRKRYPLFVCMRVYDKLNRLESCMIKDSIEVKDETIEDTLMDIANYCIMEITERRAEGGTNSGTDSNIN